MNGSLNRKLRMGLVGGGKDAFIGRVHATAATMDLRAELVAGALSSDPQRARESAPSYDITPGRAYGSYEEMIDGELNLPPDQRIDFVTIATPNNTHFDIAARSIKAGFNVICDKPMTVSMEQANELSRLVKEHRVVFCLTHNYTGYPLVRQAQEMVLADELGEIQVVRCSYIQGWLRTRLESAGQKQATWRTDPKQAGISGCFGDIGTHAFNLADFIIGFRPTEISCILKTCEPGRQLDDYGQAIIRTSNGAMITITASQISHGRENDLSIEVDGTAGSLYWRQENPNELVFLQNGKPKQTFTRNPSSGYSSAPSSCRIPQGHPEGYLEGFANVYANAFDDMIKRNTGESFSYRYPSIVDGCRGIQFLDRCVASSKNNGAFRKWDE